ncbi:MAG: hypothetical protein QW735_03640 [archaeon]
MTDEGRELTKSKKEEQPTGLEEENDNRDVMSLLNAIQTILKSPVLGQYFAHTERQRKQTFNFFISLFLLVSGIIVGMSVLVYFGKVSGDALLFLAGTVIGYVLGVFQDMVKRGNIL